MLLKMGVSVRCLKREIRRALPIIERVYKDVAGHEAVITSTTEGTHSPGSLHYVGQAVDAALPGTHGMVRKATATEVLSELRKELGPDYDVVLERDHIHVEYDPK